MPNTNTEIRDAAAVIVKQMLAENMRGHTVKEFSDKAGVSIATIRRILTPLRADGTIRSYLDPYDRKYTRWQLSTNVAHISRRRK